MDFLHRTWAEIDLSALKHNFNLIKQKVGNSLIMSVVKANAYGHSVEYIAPFLEDCGTDWFAVSNIDEAVQLRKIGIKKPILILGYTPVNMVEALSYNNISQCVYSLEYATLLSEYAKKSGVVIKTHLKLDTGMSRLGFDCRTDDLNGIDEAIMSARKDNLICEGVFTHFCESDREISSDDGWTDKQYNRFQNSISVLKSNGVKPEICHCANSAALITDKDKLLDMTRPGIILYGLSPSSASQFDIDFKPVMTLKSVVSMVKTINTGDTVSYGRTFKAEKSMKIATIAAGYADGYPRLLSNNGYVIINGKKANILGRVCMDQMSVDVSDIPDVKMGDEALLFGKELSVDVLAEKTNTINYEIVCGISPRVPRVIIKE